MRVFDAQNLTGPHIPRRGAKANPKQIQPSGRGDANHNKHAQHLLTAPALEGDALSWPERSFSAILLDSIAKI